MRSHPVPFKKLHLMSFCRILSVFILLAIGNQGFSQTKSKVSGQVLDALKSEPLIGANVYWEGQVSSGTITDIDGNFILESVTFPARLVISYLGYEKSIRVIQAKEAEKPIKFFLKPEELSLQEVIIQERRPDEQVKNLEIGKASVPIETIKNIPALFGEVDLFKP